MHTSRIVVLGSVLLALSHCATPSSTATATAKPAMAEHHHVDPSAKVAAPGEAKMGETTTCPVSGEHFTVDAQSPKVEYQGKTYYFCCEDCLGDFQKNPEKFLSKLKAP